MGYLGSSYSAPGVVLGVGLMGVVLVRFCGGCTCPAEFIRVVGERRVGVFQEMGRRLCDCGECARCSLVWMYGSCLWGGVAHWRRRVWCFVACGVAWRGVVVGARGAISTAGPSSSCSDGGFWC